MNGKKRINWDEQTFLLTRKSTWLLETVAQDEEILISENTYAGQKCARVGLTELMTPYEKTFSSSTLQKLLSLSFSLSLIFSFAAARSCVSWEPGTSRDKVETSEKKLGKRRKRGKIIAQIHRPTEHGHSPTECVVKRSRRFLCSFLWNTLPRDTITQRHSFWMTMGASVSGALKSLHCPWVFDAMKEREREK